MDVRRSIIPANESNRMTGSTTSDIAPSAPRPQPDALRRVARTFRQIGERLVRIAGQMETPEDGQDSLKLHGARAGQLLVEAARAGAGSPFDQWASATPSSPAPHEPPSEINVQLWWMHWHVFTRWMSMGARPYVPDNF